MNKNKNYLTFIKEKNIKLEKNNSLEKSDSSNSLNKISSNLKFQNNGFKIFCSKAKKNKPIKEDTKLLVKKIKYPNLFVISKTISSINQLNLKK